jgi:nucleoside-diphosphate-sugar epimerase
MSILVFGGAGFVGSYLVRKLLEEGEDVVALDVAMPDPPPPALRDVLKKVKFEYCHGEYAAEVIKMVTKHKAHAVVNLVTSSSSDLELNPQRAVRINLETQINILEAAKTFGLKRVVFSSSGHVYGAGRSEAVHEESLLKPDTLYGACKTMNEYLGAHYQKHFGVDYVALRLCLIFGWGRAQRKSVSHRGPWIIELFENPARGLPAKIPLAGTKLSMVYVKDLVAAIILALRASDLKHRVFDVVNEPHTKAEAAEIVRKLIPDAQVELDMEGAFGAPYAPDHPTPRAWQNKRITAQLGYRPKYSFEEGISDYVSMVKADQFKW